MKSIKINYLKDGYVAIGDRETIEKMLTIAVSLKTFTGAKCTFNPDNTAKIIVKQDKTYYNKNKGV